MKIWTRFPFVRLLLPLMAGIIVYKGFHEITEEYILFLFSLFVALLLVLLFLLKRQTFRKRWLFGSALNIFIFLFGLFLSYAVNQRNYNGHFSNFEKEGNAVYAAYLTEPPAERENSYKFTLQVTRVSFKGMSYMAQGRIIAYAVKDSIEAALTYGSEILFSETPVAVRKPANPGEFDYARYLAVKNVFHQVYLGKGNFMITGTHRGNPIKAIAINARDRLLRTLQHYGISGREYSVAAALLIGYDDLLDATQRQEYAGAGVVHILCVSGLHVGVIFLLADSMLFFLRKRKKAIWLRPALIIAVIWIFAMITGLAPSVMRASLMFTLITIGKSMKRQSHTYNTLAASAFILLILNPGMLYDLGFQLSYAAVVGIVTFQPVIKKIYTPGNRIVGYIWDLTCVSLAAQLATAPVSIYYFHQFPGYFLISNLIAIPLAGVLIYTGVVFIMMSFIPLLGKIVAVIMVFQIRFLNNTVSFIEGLPGSVSHNLYLSPLAAISLYFLLFILLMWYLQKTKAWMYAALGPCFLLACDYAFTAIERMNNRMIIVQSIKKHTAISFVNGRTCHIIADPEIVQNPSILSYSSESFRIKSGIRDIVYSDLSGNSQEKDRPSVYPELNSGFFNFMGKKGIVLTPEIQLPAEGARIKVDYVILTNNLRQKLEKLSHYFPGATFIADASNSVRRSSSWNDESVALRLPFYSISGSGAWVVDME